MERCFSPDICGRLSSALHCGYQGCCAQFAGAPDSLHPKVTWRCRLWLVCGVPRAVCFMLEEGTSVLSGDNSRCGAGSTDLPERRLCVRTSWTKKTWLTIYLKLQFFFRLSEKNMRFHPVSGSSLLSGFSAKKVLFVLYIVRGFMESFKIFMLCVCSLGSVVVPGLC